MGFTVIVNVVVVAHSPAVGVNVYVVVVVLFSGGDHTPVILFNDVVGNGVKGSPEQIGATALNVGVTVAPIKPTVILILSIQPLASLTVMVYGPAASPKKILLAWNKIPSLL